MSLLIYLAGPMDDVDGDFNPLTWREGMAQSRVNYDEKIAFVWLPRQADPDTAESAVLANRALISVCDGMLVNLDGGFPFGTIREIEFARFNLGKPVAVVTKRELKSFMAHDLIVAQNVATAMFQLIDTIQAQEMEE